MVGSVLDTIMIAQKKQNRNFSQRLNCHTVDVDVSKLQKFLTVVEAAIYNQACLDGTLKEKRLVFLVLCKQKNKKERLFVRMHNDDFTGL